MCAKTKRNNEFQWKTSSTNKNLLFRNSKFEFETTKVKKNVLKVNVEHKNWNNVVMRVNLFCSCVRHIETHQKKKTKRRKNRAYAKKGTTSLSFNSFLLI